MTDEGATEFAKAAGWKEAVPCGKWNGHTVYLMANEDSMADGCYGLPVYFFDGGDTLLPMFSEEVDEWEAEMAKNA